MDREVSRRFYKSKEWQECRAAYIASVGGLCERCLAEGIIKPGYIVHHKCYINASNINNPEVTLNWDNLEYLCLACHNAEHFKEKIEPRYKIDGDGSVDIAPMSRNE